jgi:hypothetical protein
MGAYTPPRCRHTVTRSGLVIGAAYQRPAPAATRDHEHLQAALLEPRTARPVSGLHKLAGRLWGWL